jgi:hypothetical protein
VIVNVTVYAPLVDSEEENSYNDEGTFGIETDKDPPPEVDLMLPYLSIAETMNVVGVPAVTMVELRLTLDALPKA